MTTPDVPDEDAEPDAPEPEAQEPEPESFDRPYVEQLRRENAAARVKAKRADDLGARLVTAYAAATGQLADPTDLPFDEALCDDDGIVDESKVRAAVEELLQRKPHLASRRPTGDVGQGARPGESSPVSLAGLLRAGAG